MDRIQTTETRMNQQTELFNLSDFEDREEWTNFSHGMTPRSTCRKQPKRRKAIALLSERDRPSNAHNEQPLGA